MPEPFDLAHLELPEHTEVPRLIREHPRTTPLRFCNDEYLLESGDTSDHIFLLLKGTCAVTPGTPAEDVGQPLGIVDATPDQPVFLGEMAYFSNQPRIASVRSCMNTWALRLGPGELEAIIAAYPLLTQRLCQQFTARMRDMIQLLERFQSLHDLRGSTTFFQPGERLYARGDPGEVLFQLVDGQVEEIGPKEEKYTHTATGATGGPILLGSRGYFLGQPHPSTATALTPVMALKIPVERREAACRAFPTAVLTLLPDA